MFQYVRLSFSSNMYFVFLFVLMQVTHWQAAEVEIKPVEGSTEVVKSFKIERCSDCHQILDDKELRMFPGDPGEAVEEFVALTDPRLSLFTGEEQEVLTHLNLFHRMLKWLFMVLFCFLMITTKNGQLFNAFRSTRLTRDLSIDWRLSAFTIGRLTSVRSTAASSNGTSNSTLAGSSSPSTTTTRAQMVNFLKL